MLVFMKITSKYVVSKSAKLTKTAYIFMHPKELTHIVWHFELVFALPYSAKVLFLFVCKPLLVNINKRLANVANCEW